MQTKASGQRMGKLTTPPPPSSELFAALTIEVVASVVMEVRMRETFELSIEDGVGSEASVGPREEG